MTPWSPADTTRLRRWANRLHAREIAEHLGRTERAVFNKAASLGVTLRKGGAKSPGAKHPDATVRAIRREFRERGNLPAVAKRHGIPLSTAESYVYLHIRP